ncbi:MAG: 1-acyl-sn-glycerol-3-phosphate acyltransferase [Burkholderiaceae bacterium]|jgi:1-acyl-sn-glycerol-3-phosphate acyltransferase|nr:1-acyl-sn-glycerol-3-phosphate acyltransferase [Burkholderiaceae bacterium]
MLHRLWRIYEAVATLAGLLLLALICLTWTLPALLLYPLLPEKTGARVGRMGIRLGFRLYLALLSLLCACRFDLRELDELAREPGPRVVVANHPSLMDALILASRLPNAVCIMKGAIAHNLLLGAGARLARYIVNDAPLPMLRRAVRELQDGATLIIFPEGTRTVTPPVDACASTAGVMARRAGVPVQTLLIEMSSPYLGKRWPLWRPPALPLKVRVRRGACWPMEDPQDRQERADGDDFGQRLRAYFSEALASELAPSLHPAAAAQEIRPPQTGTYS